MARSKRITREQHAAKALRYLATQCRLPLASYKDKRSGFALDKLPAHYKWRIVYVNWQTAGSQESVLGHSYYTSEELWDRVRFLFSAQDAIKRYAYENVADAAAVAG